MRFSLRTLIILTALIPPLLALVWWYPFTSLILFLLVCIAILQANPPEIHQ